MAIRDIIDQSSLDCGKSAAGPDVPDKLPIGRGIYKEHQAMLDKSIIKNY